MSEDDKPFIVSDRRHFTPEGSVREAEPGPDEAARSEVPGDLPSAESHDEGSREVDFGSFLLSLGAQAGALLEAAGLKDEHAAEALEGVRSLVSILEMLQAKTKGNRTDEEQRILESVLYQLRLGYVRASRTVRG